MYKNTQAIVLRRVDYRENDRMLTLFSPESGRLDALCRGCRKPKSALLAASELLTMGEYVFFSGRGRESVQSCNVIESFYPLRLDYGKLSHATLMAAACLKVIQPEEPMAHLYILLARSLKRLAYEDTPAEQVSAAFLLHFVTLSGFKPRLNHCARCGRALGEEGGFLLTEEDGVCCAACSRNAPRKDWLTFKQLSWLRGVLAHGIDKVEAPPGPVPFEPLKRYAEAKLEARLTDIKGAP